MANSSAIKQRSMAAVIIFPVITLGIYALYWAFQVGKELKEYNDSGMGEIFNLVLMLFLPIVPIFTMPNDVANAFKKENKDAEMTALTGLWILLPIIGLFIWIARVQDRLNRLASM